MFKDIGLDNDDAIAKKLVESGYLTEDSITYAKNDTDEVKANKDAIRKNAIAAAKLYAEADFVHGGFVHTDSSGKATISNVMGNMARAMTDISEAVRLFVSGELSTPEQ